MKSKKLETNSVPGNYSVRLHLDGWHIHRGKEFQRKAFPTAEEASLEAWLQYGHALLDALKIVQEHLETIGYVSADDPYGWK